MVDHDGCHALRETSSVIDLATAAHKFDLQYFEYEGNAALEVWWTKPGSTRCEIPPSALSSLACRSYKGDWSRLPFHATLAVGSAVSVTTPAK